MGHHHHNSGDNLGIAFLLNFVFTIIEFIGGMYTNSLAILSDAVHDLGDSLSLGLAWYFEKISNRPVDRNFTYGYKRFSVLGAIVNSVILILGSFFIIKSAIPRIFEPQNTHSTGMMILAVAGIFFNALGYWKTHKGHSHNEKMVSLHLLEDVLGWVAVLIGAVIIHFTGWYAIDPILSLGIALFILYNVVKNVKNTVKIILQGTPENIDLNLLTSIIVNEQSVIDVHDLHVWTMDGSHNILTAHIVVPKDMTLSKANELKLTIHEKMLQSDIHHCTIEIERMGDVCMVMH